MTRQKLMTLLEEYGQVAIYTYLGLWLLTWAGFALAISFGVSVDSAQGSFGVIGASWVATKLTQPLRIAATLALTPVVAAFLKKWRRAPSAPPAPPGADQNANQG